MINSDRSSFVDFVETYNGEESTLYYLGKLVIKLQKISPPILLYFSIDL